MSLKFEFVTLANQEAANMSALCRRFDISRKTGYKWLNRYREDGRDGLEEHSRRPERSPNKTPDLIAEAVCEMRKKHPAWGGRKIQARLREQAQTGEHPFEAKAVQPLRPVRQSSDGEAFSVLRRRGATHPTSPSKKRRPTSCGKWTSKATFRS
jgi:transposase-like protein